MAGIEIRRISVIELCEMLGIEDRKRFIDIKRPDVLRNEPRQDVYEILLEAEA